MEKLKKPVYRVEGKSKVYEYETLYEALQQQERLKLLGIDSQVYKPFMIQF